MRLALAILPMLLLSGCVVTQDDLNAAANEAADLADEHGVQVHGNATKAGAPPVGNSPVGSAPELLNLSAIADGLSITWTLLGDDADNDTVTWVFDFGDNLTANGTMLRALEVDGNVTPTGNHSLVANVTHAYAAAGTYNVTVTLTDATAAVNRTVEVVVADAAPPAVPMDPLDFTGSCTTGVSEGLHTFEVTPGQARIYATLSIGGGGFDLDWYLLDPAGNEKASGTTFTPRGEDPLETAEPAAGTWTFQVDCFLGVAASYSIHAEFV